MLISTDGRASLPAKAGQAEILNSSLEKYPELTLCARFVTHSFFSDGWPTQALISYGPDNLLGSFVARPCDQVYVGCTKIYKDLVRKNQIPWIAGKVFGLIGKVSKKKEISLMSCCSSQFFIIRKPDLFSLFSEPFLIHRNLPLFLPDMVTGCVEHGLYQCQCYPGLLQG